MLKLYALYLVLNASEFIERTCNKCKKAGFKYMKIRVGKKEERRKKRDREKNEKARREKNK